MSKDSHINSKFYFGAKCALCLAYYCLLQYLGLGIEFKFWTFILVTPIVKFFYYNDMKIFLTSVMIDTFIGTIFYQYLIHWEGVWLSLYGLLVAIWVMISEYVQYRLLGGTNESYVIKVSSNPTDFLLTPIFTATYIIVGLSLPSNLPITPWTFVFWVAIVISTDFVFGVTHYWLHAIPALRKLHLVHHEYRKEDLNTFANFYADITDALLMNITNFVLCALTIVFTQNPVVIKDFFYNGVHTHHKYPTNQITNLFYFELELIDMIMGKTRLADYHNAHHQETDKYYGGFGFFNDETLVAITSYLKCIFPSVFGSELKLNTN